MERPVALTVGVGGILGGGFRIEFESQDPFTATWADLHEFLSVITDTLREDEVHLFVGEPPAQLAWACTVHVHNDEQAQSMTAPDMVTVQAGSREATPLVVLLRQFLEALQAEPDFQDTFLLEGIYSIGTQEEEEPAP